MEQSGIYPRRSLASIGRPSNSPLLRKVSLWILSAVWTFVAEELLVEANTTKKRPRRRNRGGNGGGEGRGDGGDMEVIVAIVVVVVVVIAIVIVYYCCKSGHCNAKSHGKSASLSSISIGDDNAGEACEDPGEDGGDDSGGDDNNRGGDDGGEDDDDGGEDCGGYE